jgi:hypothetical protein
VVAITRYRRGYAGRLEDFLALQENIQPGEIRSIHPVWLEQFMGFPANWTSVESSPSAMPSSRQSLLPSGEPSSPTSSNTP